MRRGIDGRRLLIPGVSAVLALALLVGGVLASKSVAPAPLAGTHATVSVVATAPAGTSPRVAAVAVGAIVSSLRTDSGVTDAASQKPRGPNTTIAVTLRTDDAHEAAQVVGRIQGSVDPGPLRLDYRAAALTLDSAQSSLRGQLVKLELLVAPVLLLALFALLGAAGGWTALIAAAMGIGGALLAVSATGGYLLAVAPACAIAIAQAVELSGLHGSLTRDESPEPQASSVPERVLDRWLPAAGASALVRGLGPLALLATSLHGAWSVAVGAAVAAVLASVTVLVVAPSLTGLLSPRPGPERRRSGPGRVAYAVTGALARSWRWFAAVAGVALLVAVVVVLPVRDAMTTPLAAAGEAGGSVLDDVGVAAVLFGLGVGALLAAGRTPWARLRLAASGAVALLPPTAAAGVLVFAVQQGHLGGLAGPRTALVGGSLTACLAAVAAVAGGRCVLVARASREAREAGAPAAERAMRAAALTTPGILASSVMLLGCFGALCAADLSAAREAGLGIAAGVLADLLLVRLPFLGVLARWGQ